jgi:tRNA threonylcarbamoyladenosine biosynthesis protein TsaB
MGLATARALAFSLDVPVAGVSTLDALAAGAPGAVPVVDARRREVFSSAGGVPFVVRPEELGLGPGTVCVGDGAVRYRAALERAGAEIPPDESELHVPRARFHAELARDFGPAERVEPLYLRVPDAVRSAR